MVKNSFRKPIVLVFSILLITGVLLAQGCAGELNGTSAQIIKFVTPQQAFQLIQENQNNPDFIIIDDRPKDQFDSGHIENALHIIFSSEQLKDDLNKLDKSKKYLVYCRTGCGATSGTMRDLRFQEVYEISGGFTAWKSQGLPIVK